MNTLTSQAIKTITTALLLCAVAGCGKKAPDAAIPPTQAQNDLLSSLQSDYSIQVTAKAFAHTLWIYLPLEGDLLAMKAKAQALPSSQTPTVKPTILYLDGHAKDRDLILKYDIAPEKAYGKDPGYAPTYTEEVKTKQRQILTDIYRIYSNADKAPDFFVLVAADITNGVETKVIFYFDDLLRAYTDQSFQEEYAKRFISEPPAGDGALIGDKAGASIDYHDITWPEFLVKQMIHRITFKYTQSEFPPSNDSRAELLRIAADTVGSYQYDDFSELTLVDLDKDATFSFTPEELAGYRSESNPPPAGRLIHLKLQPASP